ncbi:MAG TPA: ABC transporter ATP-binding protein [Ktedonobacterales bacterium]|nr:ABC transporter ATP-binding protein [Ktedonobacterales bacterium]
MAQIEFAAVTKHFPGSTQAAVDGVSFTVREGAICILLGTSGSGKTTLLRMVNRLIDPTSGQIIIDGVPTTEQNPIALRRSIGYVIQQIGLFPHLTIAENVRVVPSILGQSPRQTAGRVDELLKLVGLDPKEYRKRYPRQLSGGQQQRVGLARALAADPQVLLMDEPFGALDAITRERMQGELLRIQRGVRKTILFVTHDVEEAFKLGDQIAVLSEGKLVQVGTPVELLSKPATAFVRRLVGADNILRQLEYLPATLAIKPSDGKTERSIGPDATLLQALLKLIETQAESLTVEDEHQMLGQITLSSIYEGLQTGRRQHAGEEQPDAEVSIPSPQS